MTLHLLFRNHSRKVSLIKISWLRCCRRVFFFFFRFKLSYYYRYSSKQIIKLKMIAVHEYGYRRFLDKCIYQATFSVRLEDGANYVKEIQDKIPRECISFVLGCRIVCTRLQNPLKDGMIYGSQVLM